MSQAEKLTEILRQVGVKIIDLDTTYNYSSIKDILEYNEAFENILKEGVAEILKVVNFEPDKNED